MLYSKFLILYLLEGTALAINTFRVPRKLVLRPACNGDNCLNAFHHSLSLAGPFCSTYIQSTTTVTATPIVTISGDNTVTLASTTYPSILAQITPTQLFDRCSQDGLPATSLASRLSSACSCLSLQPLTVTTTVAGPITIITGSTTSTSTSQVMGTSTSTTSASSTSTSVTSTSATSSSTTSSSATSISATSTSTTSTSTSSTSSSSTSSSSTSLTSTIATSTSISSTLTSTGTTSSIITSFTSTSSTSSTSTSSAPVTTDTGSCLDFPSPYTVNNETFTTGCGDIYGGAEIVQYYSTSYGQCLDQCSITHDCIALSWYRVESLCILFNGVYYISLSPDWDIATLVSPEVAK